MDKQLLILDLDEMLVHGADYPKGVLSCGYRSGEGLSR
jgi:hypothetical protein